MENYRLTQTGEEVQSILNGAAMQTDLTAEVERAEGAEQTLQGNIDEEERRAKAAEETLSGAIGDEELRAKAAEEALGGAIDDINAKIPAAASSENKLADQNFVNSSIETATATFRGTYNLVSDLHLAVDATHEQIATLLGTVIAEADKNDYSYVLVPTSASTPTEIASIEKYTFGANGWAFAYALNNSGFTSAQWAAINSGITSGLVAKLNALPTNTDLLALLAGKQDVLTFDDVPVEGSVNPVKSGGVHSAIDDEKTARVNAMNQLSGRVDTIEGEIPAQASSENQLADKNYVNSSISTNTATYRGSFNLVADLGLSVSATHEQIGTALAGEISTADNNDYAYVQVPTSDETPSQILKVERYKYNGTAWAFEYKLNNSGFTSAQWAALNSGITSGLVGKLNALPTNDELTLALAGKQDVLTFDNTPTENSNNPVKSGGVYAADKALSDAIEAILLLIPSAATSLNKLVDTDLMNSSISTATATFRGTFNLVSDLSLDLTATHAQIATALAGEIATADNNDYCFVQIPTAVGTPTEIAQTDRYKFNGTAWAFEYTLNNSGFTAAQWAAINSAITTELVAKLIALPTNAELLESLGLLSSGISGINAKIPSAASSENKLVDGTAMETYVAQIVNAIDATFNVTSTDGHVTLAITQVNGAIASVQLTTSDIASAAALNLKASQADLTALAGRVTTAESDIDTLTNLYNALQQSAPQVIQPTDTWPVATPSTTVIYRVIDRVNTPPEYYSDYMWNGTAFVLMATYNNAIDDVPTAGSNNLVKSGGVFDSLENSSNKIFANLLNNDMSNIDIAHRISFEGAIISNSDATNIVINKPLSLVKGIYYIMGSGLDRTPPRMSLNGTSLLQLTTISTGKYSFELSADSVVYVQMQLNSELSALRGPVAISSDLDFDRYGFKTISKHYLGLDEIGVLFGNSDAKDFKNLIQEVSYNLFNPDEVVTNQRYSYAQGQIISNTYEPDIIRSGYIPVEEGETYCLSGTGVYSNWQAGYFTTKGINAISNVVFYLSHSGGRYFTVPTGSEIKYIVANLNASNGELSGNVQLEIGENATEWQPYNPVPKIITDLLPESGGGAETDESLLDKYMDFMNIHYSDIGSKIPKFRQHYLLKDKDVVVVNTGTSLTARDYCAAHPDAAYRPPLLHTYNLPTFVWDKLNWGKQQYRRYDAKTIKNAVDNYFTEVGSFSTVDSDSLWDDSSYRRGYTRLASSGNNSVSFTVPKEAWQFNFIYRTDAQGCEECTLAITGGNGLMEVWNGSAWVEANGYTFSMKESAANVIPSVSYIDPYTGNTTSASNIPTGGNTTYQKRLKMRATSHTEKKADGTIIVAGVDKQVTISGTGRFMYWGVEWSPRKYMVTYINAARGSHSPLIGQGNGDLIRYQDNDIWQFNPDLILTEDPIYNGGGGSASYWFNGTTPKAIMTYWSQVVENFFFASNQVSMTARATTLFGSENVPEFAIFGPYSTALDGKVDDDGQLRAYPTADDYMLTVADALISIVNHMRIQHPDLIYIDCIRPWLEVCEKVYGNISDATASTGYTGNSLCADGVHPNTNGSKVWARLVLPILDLR